MKYKHGVINAGIFAGLLGISLAGWANCGITSSAGISYVALPSTPLIIDKGATTTGPVGNARMLHAGAGAYTYFHPGACVYRIKYGTPQIESGYGTGVYQTNVPGLGFKLSTQRVPAVFQNSDSHWYTVNFNGFLGGSMDLGLLDLQFYVTGPISPGEVNFSAIVEGTIDSRLFQRTTITGTIPVRRSGCLTPDITVDLKRHSSTDFPHMNATSAATPFNFRINECEAGMNSVSYTFAPAGGITLNGAGTSQQHLTLSSASTAQGVGVQVLYDNDTPVPFNSKTAFSRYNKASGGNFSIPMKARYIRTGAIKAGTANSAVEFTMAYE